MTIDNLTQEFARLNELAKSGTIKDEIYGESISFDFAKSAPDAVALANKLHALLVQAEEALTEMHTEVKKYHYANEKRLPIQEIRLRVFSAQQKAAIALTAIRNAGIGRE